MNEAETKYALISPALHKAGWGEVPGSLLRLEFPITNNKPTVTGRPKNSILKADYVLVYKNQCLGVVEAKPKSAHYTEGTAQAKNYAELLHLNYAYATNGLKIREINLATGFEGDVTSFPSPDQLWERIFPPPTTKKEEEVAAWQERLHKPAFAAKGGRLEPRYYQHNAINKVLNAIAKKQNRILLTLATGTGKTLIALQIAWKLFHAKWNLRRDGTRSPRILFLADRNILATQAFNAFSAFEDDARIRIKPSEIKKKGHVPKNGSIFFTIFQTFLSGAEGAPSFGEYPEDFFDLIIIDECHRGGANDESSWRKIMEYFSPAVQLGLTATPKLTQNSNTYKYFGEPVYSYKLKDGISDGFLTPFKVKEISTTIDSYIYTSDDDVEGEIEKGKEYKEPDFNKKIEIPAREEYRIKLLLRLINQNHKTLVFCANQKHALVVRDIINENANSKNSNYCQRVTSNDGELGEQYLRDFQDNERTIPTILTTSQKLSTGVDAHEVRNIVLMRPINSMIEFKQIIGRGTRLCEGKNYFTILDFVKAHNLFNHPEWDGEPLELEEVDAKNFNNVEPINEENKVCNTCNANPCRCKAKHGHCKKCNNNPCVCEDAKKIIKVTLAENKVIEIDSMVKTSFCSASGEHISAENFIKQFYSDLSKYFNSSQELEEIWSDPTTREELLKTLAENGYEDQQLEDLQKLIHGEDSDLFDVLKYIAYSSKLIARTKRAYNARQQMHSYNQKQQEFLDFVLSKYVTHGVKELSKKKLPILLQLKYKEVDDGLRELGLGDLRVGEMFASFQAYLYKSATS